VVAVLVDVAASLLGEVEIEEAAVDSGGVVDIATLDGTVEGIAVLAGGSIVTVAATDTVEVDPSPFDGIAGLVAVTDVGVEHGPAARAGEATAIAPTPTQIANTTGIARWRPRPTMTRPPPTASSAITISIVDELPVAGSTQSPRSSAVGFAAEPRITESSETPAARWLQHLPQTGTRTSDPDFTRRQSRRLPACSELTRRSC
jgi:hypothetical protein